MSEAPLSRDDFKLAVSQLKAEVGESSQSIDFSAAYDGYILLTRMFGHVNLEVTERGDRKRVEMVPKLD